MKIHATKGVVLEIARESAAKTLLSHSALVFL